MQDSVSNWCALQCCREEACFGDGSRFVQTGLFLGSPFHGARFDLYLSGADETTPGTTLYSCLMGTYVPTAPHWHFASDNGYAVTQIADHDTVKPWRTLYRWLHKIEDGESSGPAANKTPAEIASLVWEITKANLSWGRIRIANQLRLLGIFLPASTVRNILQRPRPRDIPTTPATSNSITHKGNLDFGQLQ